MCYHDQDCSVLFQSVTRGFGGSFAILNFTVQERSSGYNVSANMSAAERDHYGITLTYLPFGGTAAQDIENLSRRRATKFGSARGSNCTFYNATYMAEVLFINSTQINAVNILEYHEPLNMSTKFTPDLCRPDYFQNGTVNTHICNYPTGQGQAINLLALADSFSSHLEGPILVPYHTGTPTYNRTTDLIGMTDLFTLTLQAALHLNTVAGGIANLSQRLTDLMANMTLNFMNIDGIGNTSVLASIPSTTSVFKYNWWSHILTYVIAVLITSIIAVIGLTSLISNGVESSNTFSQIMVTTRNPRLDLIARGACLGSAAVQNMSFYDVQLKYGKIKSNIEDFSQHAGFGVIADEDIDPLTKGDVVY
jgi:hypothetical protein